MSYYIHASYLKDRDRLELLALKKPKDCMERRSIDNEVIELAGEIVNLPVTDVKIEYPNIWVYCLDRSFRIKF